MYEKVTGAGFMMNEDDTPFRNIFIFMWKFRSCLFNQGQDKNASIH